MRYVSVLVERNEHLAVPRQVPSWEIPVLELVHGAEKVIRGDTVEVDGRDYPEAGPEFDRLAIRYGQHVASETPYAVMVYGQAPKGVEALAERIEKERLAEKAAKQSNAKAVKAAAKQLAVVEDDPTA